MGPRCDTEGPLPFIISEGRMTYHRFSAHSDETQKWTNVQIGDLVCSPGTMAYKANEFADRTTKTRWLILSTGLLLVLSRHDGIPGEPNTENESITFVVLSRHGPLVINHLKKNYDADKTKKTIHREW
jgi:hypothetical protein